MKELTRVRLINWHYFSNEELDIRGSVLLTGDNGTGKSTILDAIQYVLVADLRQVRFNVSAHEETRRDLLGYLRCKTGIATDNGEKSLRQGDITSYIALEFHDRSKDEYFIVGAVMDSYADGMTYKTNFFKIEKQRTTDDLFLAGKRPRNIREFKVHMKGYDATVYPSVEQYREDLLMKLGSLGERFFSLFVKAISFKPITDIRQFVYSYVLDEKRVNIDIMRENFERYKEYSDLVEQTKAKIAALEGIRAKHEDIGQEYERALTQDYLICRATLEQEEERLQELVNEESRKSAALDEVLATLDEARHDEETLDQRYIACRDLLAANATYQRIRELQAEISRLNQERSNVEARISDLKRLAAEESQSVSVLIKTAPPESLEEGRKSLDRLRDLLDAVLHEDAGVKECTPEIERARELFANLNFRWSRELWERQNQLQSLDQQARVLEKELASLRAHKLVYDKRVTDLRDLIAEKAWEDLQADVTPAILCELLEVPNERWQDAVEGFLNTQRFDLIVPPRHFDFALSVYEQYKRARNISGVGLVNTGKVLEGGYRAEPNSLATEVATDNPYARAYIDLLLGRVIKCESEQELKRYRQAITPTCMTYRNNVARQIHFHVYETPYIGQRAYARQIARKEAQMREIDASRESLKAECARRTMLVDLTAGKDERLYRMRENLGAFEDLQDLKRRLAALERELDSIDVSDVKRIEDEMAQIKAELDRARERIRNLSRQEGRLASEIKACQERQVEAKLAREQKAADLRSFLSHYPGREEAWEDRYRRERVSKPAAQIVTNFTASRKGLETIIAKKREDLALLQVNYNSAYHFGGLIDADNIDEYEAERRKLIESELPEYEEKINVAKKEAEEEFKEHFVYRLKENIETAQMEFGLLNDALKQVEFGGDHYHFMATPSAEYKKFYDMIMDAHLVEGSLFDDAFQSRHKEAIDTFFERILTESEDELNESLDLFTDYRTYLDYDIRITNSSGEPAYFSRVCREKSGGETQTPYYVAIVASFLQLYRARTSEQTIRLMMFDEAFNRMDSDRIENSLKFISSLGLQCIIAAPTEKCEYITPHVTTTLLVMRNGNYSWIEDYKRLKDYEQPRDGEQLEDAV
ncbi:MAG: ATP-binding protein [Bacteroidota bacterium]